MVLAPQESRLAYATIVAWGREYLEKLDAFSKTEKWQTCQGYDTFLIAESGIFDGPGWWRELSLQGKNFNFFVKFIRIYLIMNLNLIPDSSTSDSIGIMSVIHGFG